MNGTMESLRSLVSALDEAKLDSNTGESAGTLVAYQASD